MSKSVSNHITSLESERNKHDSVYSKRSINSKVKQSSSERAEVNNSLISSLPIIIIGLSEDLRVIHWNQTAQQIFNISPNQTLGAVLESLSLKWDWSIIKQGLIRCSKRQNGIKLDSVRYQRHDNQEGRLALDIMQVVNSDNGSREYLVSGRDITEQKILEGHLAHAQKMESIGQLAAGIAHEINTPTQFVGDNLHFLKTAFSSLLTAIEAYEALAEQAKDISNLHSTCNALSVKMEELDFAWIKEQIPKALNQSLEGIHRVSDIVQAMKDFSHPSTEEKQRTDINKALLTTITVAKNEWKYVADVVTEFDANLPLVMCLPGEINQVFLNLIVNAAHAISDAIGKSPEKKGKITISTTSAEYDVVIKISDTGVGIPKAIHQKIFDPFFTTKPPGIGTGQGLAISHKIIVNQHNGSIHFESEVGKGSTFYIKLPISGE